MTTETKVIKQIGTLKKGDFFMLKDVEPKESNVWCFDGYNRNTRKYTAHKFSDINHHIEKQSKYLVYTEFTF